MRFTFQPVVYYERAMMDGKEGPQERKVPLEGKPPLVESVDVGFLDPGNGQTQKRTKFSFKVTRGHGYEAGEYDVTIKDGRTDAPFGAAAHIVFEGDNEIIDRRAIVFSGEKKKEKAKEGDEEKKDEKKKELSPDDPGYWEGGPKNTEKQEQVEPKGGCGCRVGGSGPDANALAAGAAAMLLGLGRLRRRARRTANATHERHR
jgi:MYXO-CTERM domain-containing protein